MTRHGPRRQRRPDPFRAAKAMMTEAALAMLAHDPARVEKANRALAALRAAQGSEVPMVAPPCDSACKSVAESNAQEETPA